MIEIVLGVALFTAIILFLAGFILTAKQWLVPAGSVRIIINDSEDKALSVQRGGKLLSVLADEKIFVSSACGGGGSCGQCKVIVHEGGGDILPTEKSHINRKMEREGYRLSCQLTVKEDLKIEVPAEVFSARQWECELISNRNVATFIKEIVLKLPEGEDVNFRAGGYIQVMVPPYEADFIQIDVGEKYHAAWEKFGIYQYSSKVDEPVVRAYSMANYPDEKGVIKLNVRIATPPPKTVGIPPGKGSTYLHTRKPGDKITITGPFGEFHATDNDTEMIFLGGGAGMAPLRSIVFDELKRKGTKRKISYWYGARSVAELFYDEDFKQLEKEFENFSWHVVMSEPLPEDNWTGYKGFVHCIAYDAYLRNHPAPEDCEYYLCGPPVMIDAVLDLLDRLGVEPENIYFDDFGG
nr:NADH:ubiquinone reductase (Na(+)-transporting) subunit F [Geovibrio thiophilus]